jgi:hypothetical protein
MTPTPWLYQRRLAALVLLCLRREMAIQPLSALTRWRSGVTACAVSLHF